MRQTKLFKNKTTKYLLLGLVPTVLVSTITLAAIYGSKTSKQEVPSILLKEEEVTDEDISDELNSLYDEQHIDKTLDSSEKQKMTDILVTSVKKEVDEAKSNGITIDKLRLKDIIRRELDDALLILEVKLSGVMQRALVEDKEADVQALYSVYEQKHQGAKNIVIETLEEGVSSDMFNKLLFMWPHKHLKHKVEFHEVYHKEHLINLIRDVDAWVDYNIERNNLIKTANDRYATFEYKKYLSLWDVAFEIQESYVKLGKRIKGWVNFNVNSKLDETFKNNLAELKVEQVKVKEWLDKAKILVANKLEDIKRKKAKKKMTRGI